VRAKQFTQDIIDTLGNRVTELIIPVPRDKKTREHVAARAQEIIECRAKYRDEASQLPLDLQGKRLDIEGLED
jgi:type I restriction enzyme M protein